MWARASPSGRLHGWEAFRKQKGGLTAVNRDRNAKAKGTVGEPCSFHPNPSIPPLPIPTTLTMVGTDWASVPGKGEMNKDRMSQILIPRALREALRGWGVGYGDL